MFEKVTKDILMKIDDEDLLNRSKSIKLGYNNFSLFKNDENNVRAVLKQRKSDGKESNLTGGQFNNYYENMKCCNIF